MGLNKVTNGSRNVLIVCVTVMFCGIVTASVVIVGLTHDVNSSMVLVTLLIGLLGPTIASVATLIKGETIKQTAEETNDKVDRVLNGEMADKIKQAYHDAMNERARGERGHRT